MTIKDLILFDYWRSSSSYRVRIALNLLGIPFNTVAVNLLSGEQRSPENLARNPQGLVPTLEVGEDYLTQSLAIIEYLHESTPGSTLLPDSPLARARVRALAYAVAMEIHPVCNLSVVANVLALTRGDDATRAAWMCKFIREGLVAVEEMLNRLPFTRFCFGAEPTLADVCLVPQVYNANRWGAETSDLTRILSVMSQCDEHPAFKAAYPANPAESA